MAVAHLACLDLKVAGVNFHWLHPKHILHDYFLVVSILLQISLRAHVDCFHDFRIHLSLDKLEAIYEFFGCSFLLLFLNVKAIKKNLSRIDRLLWNELLVFDRFDNNERLKKVTALLARTDPLVKFRELVVCFYWLVLAESKKVLVRPETIESPVGVPLFFHQRINLSPFHLLLLLSSIREMPLIFFEPESKFSQFFFALAKASALF